MISTESGVNREGRPFVHLSWGKEAGQMTPDETRALARTLLEAAEAAEMDATVFDWLALLVEPIHKRAQILATFRQHRDRARAKGEEP